MRFIQVLVDGTINVIEKDPGNKPKYYVLTDYLHSGYIDIEHPTNIRDDIWMVEDDAYEYVQDDEWDKYTNKFACKVDKRGNDCMGEFVIFKIGNWFNASFDNIENQDELLNVNLNDIIDFTDEEIEMIKNIINS